MRIEAWLACLLAVGLPAASAAAQYDVVIIGGTPAGIAAAIAAGRAGKSVMLVEQAPVLGGMLSSGVSLLDDGTVEASSGVMEEFRQRVKQYHLSELASDPVVKNEPTVPYFDGAEGQAWEPKTAARIYAEMVAEVPTVAVRFNEVPVGATVKGERVVAVSTRARDNRGRMGGEHLYTGDVFIDATYEGDVAAFADVPFRVGREARSEEEPHAGIIYTCSDTLPGTIMPGSTGEADDEMQAFTYRFVVKDYGRVDHPYRLDAPPPGYDADKYKWNPESREPRLPNDKLDVLSIVWGNDLTGYSTRYVLAGWEERAGIEEIYRNHALGYLYYIQTEAGSPQYGLANDEFTDNDHWPYRLYVREGRRIEGLYTLTESDIHRDLRGNGSRGPLHADSVAIGAYEVASHQVHSQTDRDHPCAGEGLLGLAEVTGPYQIPYGVMVPKEKKGLLVPVAISSTHIAISTVRMEPVWSSLGQAAGVAAVLALDNNSELKEVSVEAIQDRLLEECSLLFFYKDQSCDRPEYEAVQKLSLLGAVEGTENYYFRSDEPITLGDFARMAIEGLDVPLSITAEHFGDVPRRHPAFKYIETLYDYSTQSAEPFLPYEVRRHLTSWQYDSTLKGPPVFVYPDQAVTNKFARTIVSGLLQKDVPPSEEPDSILTRSRAALLIYR